MTNTNGHPVASKRRSTSGRVEQRQERERLRKRSQRQNYIIGELICNYFPELRQIEPGTKEENKVRFALLTCVLKLMANSPDLIRL